MKSTSLIYDRDALAQAVATFPSLRVLVLGDLMLDRFIWGSVSRISPEAPVPVVEVYRETSCLGGAANVSMNIRALDAMPVPLGIIGKDPEGETLVGEFRDLKIPTRGIVRDAGRATSVKTRIIAHHQQVCRTDRENRAVIPATIEKKIAKMFVENLRSCAAVIVSDYAKGLISPSLLRHTLPRARAAKRPVFVDPKMKNLAAYRPSTVITPNTMEAENASGIHISDKRSLVKAGRRILRATGSRYLLVTRGEEGMALFDGDSRVIQIPTHAREVFDVTGAGDTVISVLTLGVVAGLSILEASVLANIAAGIVVGKLGTAAVSREELIARIMSE